MTEAYSKMIQQMMESGQEMMRAFNPAMEGMNTKGFESIFPTMSKDMMEMWFGKAFNREGLDARTRLLITLAALTVLGAQAEAQVKMTVRHALEAGATHEMLDMVLSLGRGKRPQNANEVRAMLETAGVTVADNVLRTLLTFSQAVKPDGNKETIKSIVIGISEARRDEFYVRNAALPKIQTGRRERKHA